MKIKNFTLLVFSVSLILLINGCSKDVAIISSPDAALVLETTKTPVTETMASSIEIEETTQSQEVTPIPSEQILPELLNSIDEFKKSIEHEKGYEKILSYLLIPEILPDGFKMNQIMYRENMYIAMFYNISDYMYNEALDSYENERLSMATYTVYMFEDGHEAFKINHGGKSYFSEYSSNGNLIGHEFAFVHDNMLIEVHLPAIEGIDENTGVKYLKMTRV